MNTTMNKQTGKRMEWNLDDPKVQRGLARLLKDLQAIMTEDQFQEVLLKTKRGRSPSGHTEVESVPTMPVSSLQAAGDAISHEVKSRKRSSRHAA